MEQLSSGQRVALADDAADADSLSRASSTVTTEEISDLTRLDPEAQQRLRNGGIQRVLIIGGGIGGLALACGLSRLGIEVDVAEKNRRTSGSGIGLWGFAIRAFEMLGLKDELLRVGFRSNELASYDATGNLQKVVPFSEVAYDPEQPPQLAVSRPALAQMLEENAVKRGVKIHNHTTFLWAHDYGDGVQVQLTDGTVGEYDLVVGADGAFSTVREQLLHHPGPPLRGDQGNWQITVPRDRVPMDRNSAFFTDDALLFVYPSSDSTCFVGVNDSLHDRPATREEADQRVLERLALFDVEPARQLAALVEEGAVEFEFRRIHYKLVTPPWYTGRTVLIGDAAHAAPPNLGGGASMAVEDAAVLMDAIAHGANAEGILEDYMERRWSRIQTVFARSYQVYSMGNRDPEKHFSIYSPVLREVLQELTKHP